MSTLTLNSSVLGSYFETYLSKENIEKSKSWEGKKNNCIPADNAFLFDLVDLFHPGSFVVIGGESGVGKSTLMYTLIKFIKLNLSSNIMLLSPSTSNDQLITNLLSCFCEVPRSKLYSGLLLPYEWDRIEHYANSLISEEGRIDIFDNISDVLCSLIQTYPGADKDSYYYLFIDYIQLLEGYESGNSLYEKMTNICHSLKAISKQYNICIIALSPTGKFSMETPLHDEFISFSLRDFRDAPSLGEDPDVVMMLDRPELRHVYQDNSGRDLHDQLAVHIIKNRLTGWTGYKYLHFDSFSDCILLPSAKEEILTSKLNKSEEK